LPDDVRGLAIVPSGRFCHDADILLGAAHIRRDGGETLFGGILRRSLCLSSVKHPLIE
jgi:hypothetical protein